MLLLALGQADFQLGAPCLPIELQRYQCVAAALHLAHEVIELTPIQQQLARASRIGIDMGGGRIQGADVRAEQEGFAVLHIDVGLGNLRFAGAHALDLPTHEGNAGLEALFDEVVEARLAIDGDGRKFVGGLHREVKSTDSAMAAPALLPENARMQVVERSALVTYTPAQMFALVNDVTRYPDFLPWCIGVKVDDVSASERIATLKIARGVLQTEFTTRNTLLQDAQIHMHLMHGPFRDLTGVWRFEGIGTRGSRVQFRVQFEFKNRLTAAAFDAAFETLCGSIVDAFAQRAQQVYG
jgi:ribosome-associated toxin RatA of RatAB toxin-antitoxin module